MIRSESLNKFNNPDYTISGERRAKVELKSLKTLWFNTGTLCNIECKNCYIESSPTNDDLVYIKVAEVQKFINEILKLSLPVQEIGLTGGEPFMNPDITKIIELCLCEGFNVLVLTNAMAPMMRKKIKSDLIKLNDQFGDQIVIRVSLDHWDCVKHDAERGLGTFEKTIEGMRWLNEHNIKMAVAGRSEFSDNEQAARIAYEELFRLHNFKIDAFNPSETVLFPELEENAEVPEITESCWNILNKSPNDLMCSNSRMVVKRKRASLPSVVACTLLPYDLEFDLGTELKNSLKDVALNHVHCSKFCVLGGASCSA